MRLTKTPIHGLMIAESIAHCDHRGAFQRYFCQPSLEDAVGTRSVVQINYSRTEHIGAIRGMHFQYPPFCEMKLVRCTRGKVWDVAVDLRHGSATFLKWHAEVLSPNNNRMFIIPEGFAHGFQVLEPGSELLYLHTALYNPEAEGAIRFDDPHPGIRWPIEATDISHRDQNHPLLSTQFAGIIL